MYLSVGKSLCVVHGGGSGRLFNIFILGVGALMRRGRFFETGRYSSIYGKFMEMVHCSKNAGGLKLRVVVPKNVLCVLCFTSVLMASLCRKKQSNSCVSCLVFVVPFNQPQYN